MFQKLKLTLKRSYHIHHKLKPIALSYSSCSKSYKFCLKHFCLSDSVFEILDCSKWNPLYNEQK